MKPIGVKSGSYAEYNIGCHVRNKIGCHVRISKCKNIFAIGYVPNWSEEVFVISNLNGKEIDGIFYEKVQQKTDQGEFKVEKIIQGKGDELCDCDNPFNSWIDKKRCSIATM